MLGGDIVFCNVLDATWLSHVVMDPNRYLINYCIHKLLIKLLLCFQGSGYRCIRINGKMDPVISQAGESCGLSPQLIHSIFPSELTMWIDPREVSYRIGENGSICVLYEHKEGTAEPWQPNQHGKSRQQTTSSSSTSTTPSSNSTGNSAASSASPSPTNDNEQPATAAPAPTTCSKDLSLRKMDYLLDPRKSVSIEQLAAYVGSA